MAAGVVVEVRQVDEGQIRPVVEQCEADAAAIHSVLRRPAIGPQNCGKGKGPGCFSRFAATSGRWPAIPNALLRRPRSAAGVTEMSTSALVEPEELRGS